MADRDEPQILVFVHVPKTAGTTLRTVLTMNAPGAQSRPLGNVFKGGGGVSKGLVERLRENKGPSLKGVRLVRGHFPLGIRDYLPNYIPKGRKVRCFTFLREPVDRTLSHYFQILETRGGSDTPGRFVNGPLPSDATVDDMLEGGYIHDNLHTRMLSGLPEPFDAVTEEMLEQAKRNLREELVFFGLTERFDESLVLAKQRLGFRSILYKSSGRVNTKRPRGDEVSEELAAAAERCNRYDIELYRYAEELFDGAPELRELDFQVELAALRLARDEGEADLDRPAPAGFGGDEEAWRMLVGTRATLLQREWSFVRDHRSEATSTVHDDDLEGELEDARLRTEELEQEVGRLSKAAESRMNAHSDRLKVARARTRELEQEVKRLRSADARVAELEQELKRLEAADSRVAELERDVNRLEAANSRVAELEREVERLETAKAKLKRDSKRGAKAGKSRPKRDAKRGGAKRSGAPRTKKATPHGAARRKERTPPTADAGAVSRGASDG